MDSRLSAIVLIPWDPDSLEHVNRMKQQRIACGWKEEAVESWRESQAVGKTGLHWIVLPPSHPETTPRLQKHVRAYPDEDTPLQDTSRLVLSRSRTPDTALVHFVPIGHISLDAWAPDPELDTSASSGVYSITTFYISRALQKTGLGVTALSSCERLAATAFGARSITLETIGNEECMPDNPRRIATNKLHIPKPTNEDWYQRRGYKVYLRKKNAWFDTDPTGRKWGVTGIFLRKDLV